MTDKEYICPKCNTNGFQQVWEVNSVSKLEVVERNSEPVIVEDPGNAEGRIIWDSLKPHHRECSNCLHTLVATEDWE